MTNDHTLYVVEVKTPAPSRSSATPDAPTPPRPSPPQPAGQAIALVRALLGCPQRLLDPAQTTWRCAIAGGQRTIHLHAATAAGQLAL